MNQALSEEVTIGAGNQKLGAIATFSLPSETTCPGASAWCSRLCYAVRMEKRWLNCGDAYAFNFLASLNPESFVQGMLNRIPPDLPALRIHVGGDFYAAFYAEAWRQICRQRPHTRFWAYTRSWTVTGIRQSLEDFKQLPNVQIFASTDPSMPLPPQGWRIAFVNDDSRKTGLLCPEQQDRVSSCGQCGYCFRQPRGNVVFQVH